MDVPKKRSPTFRLKAAGIVFAIYLASFGVFMMADDHGLLGRPPSRAITAPYAPLIWFYSQVSRVLK